jgi:hypothetical protein
MPTHIPVKIPAKMALKMSAKGLKKACKGTSKMPQNARKSNRGISCFASLCDETACRIVSICCHVVY